MSGYLTGWEWCGNDENMLENESLALLMKMTEVFVLVVVILTVT